MYKMKWPNIHVYKIKIKIRTLYLWLPLPQPAKEVLKVLIYPVLKQINASIQSRAITNQTKEKNKLSVKKLPDSQIFVEVFYTEHHQELNRYVKYSEKGLDPLKLPLRCIAFYLPQFHPIPENDEWWGKGFTEWTNVTRAIPQFVGHYQPHLPGDLGFYDLRLIENMHKQAALAKHYGLAGFCIYYYWFRGKRLLELPHQQILDNPDLDMPFCLCWANENWTRRWDGQEKEILMAQLYSEEDDMAMIADLVSSFRDQRYIRIDGKPVFLVYRPMILPDLAATLIRWRTYCNHHGVGDIYLIAIESFELIDPLTFGFDAISEFPPHQVRIPEVNNKVDILNPNFKGKIYDFNDMVDCFIQRSEPDYIRFSGIVTSWDNEARLLNKGHMFINSNPNTYAGWLHHACSRTIKHLPDGERLIFVNAWNEWAEGAHLEPDRLYGYGYLQATSTVLKQFVPIDKEFDSLLETSRQRFTPTAVSAVMIHLFYFDLLEDMVAMITPIINEVDIFMTVSQDLTLSHGKQLCNLFPKAYILPVGNRGRDILPFFQLLPVVQGFGYHQICKLHTKKSLQLAYGDQWRIALWKGLMDTQNMSLSLKLFDSNPRIGLIATRESLVMLNNPVAINIDNRIWLNKLIPRIHPSYHSNEYHFDFPAGSMFWFRPKAILTLNQLGLKEDDFEPELGQYDGTLAHALERLFGLITTQNKFLVVPLE